MDETLKLLSQTFVKNEYGINKPVTVEKEVFCKVFSITRQEMFEGGRNGLNPAFQFMIFAAEYDGEPACEYQGNVYSIYRTYHKPDSDYLELYVERKGGLNKSVISA